MLFLFLYLSHILQLTPQQQGAEPRNSAGAEALAVARRPKETSREKTRTPWVSRGSSPFRGLDVLELGLTPLCATTTTAAAAAAAATMTTTTTVMTTTLLL